MPEDRAHHELEAAAVADMAQAINRAAAEGVDAMQKAGALAALMGRHDGKQVRA